MKKRKDGEARQKVRSGANLSSMKIYALYWLILSDILDQRDQAVLSTESYQGKCDDE